MSHQHEPNAPQVDNNATCPKTPQEFAGGPEVHKLLSDMPLSDFDVREWVEYTYKYIAYDYRTSPEMYDEPAIGVGAASLLARERGWHTLSFWLTAYQVGLWRGEKLKNIKAAMLNRLDMGLSWRQVAYPDYKAPQRKATRRRTR